MPEEAAIFIRGLDCVTCFVIFYLALQGSAFARSATILTWEDQSANEEGFIVERTEAGDCLDGWEAIAYTGVNQNFLMDVYIPGACYRVAAYNESGASAYSNPIRIPGEIDSLLPSVTALTPSFTP